MAYEELKASGITAKTPSEIMLGAGTIHKNLYFGYYTVTTSGTSGALEVVADSTPSPTASQIKLSVAQAKCKTTLTAGDYVILNSKWNFDDSLIGATSGGNKLSIKRETINVEPDGAMVKVKGLEFKTSETATLEVNLLEINKDNVMLLTGGKLADISSITGYDEIISKAQIGTGDYLPNFGFIGKRTDGTPIIVIFDNALCTSGLDIDAKNKENSTFPATFECYADLSDNPNVLPWHIYIPNSNS